MKINEITATPFAKVKSVSPQGSDPTKSIVVLTTPDGKEIQTTQDNLIPGGQPNTYQLKSDSMPSTDSSINPGDSIVQTQGNPTQTMGSSSEVEVNTAEEQGIGGDPTDDFIDDVEDKSVTRIKRLAGI